ncbi:MAG TPA: PaaI family thioesterase [Solirubrobacteraceae bacterium]|nr:PaaI family thioesterase [Solirubrobacteraceae bacterium]
MSAADPPSRSHDAMCMACGPANPHSLGLVTRLDDDRVRGRVRLDARHSGAPGFAHGGALAAIMDDLFGHVLIQVDRPAVTATLTVDFRAPALLGRDLDLEAHCERIEGRKLSLRGEIRDGDTIVAEGRAIFVEVDISHWEASGAPLPDSWRGWGAGRRRSAESDA